MFSFLIFFQKQISCLITSSTDLGCFIQICGFPYNSFFFFFVDLSLYDLIILFGEVWKNDGFYFYLIHSCFCTLLKIKTNNLTQCPLHEVIWRRLFGCIQKSAHHVLILALFSTPFCIAFVWTLSLLANLRNFVIPSVVKNEIYAFIFT